MVTMLKDTPYAQSIDARMAILGSTAATSVGRHVELSWIPFRALCDAMRDYRAEPDSVCLSLVPGTVTTEFTDPSPALLGVTASGDLAPHLVFTIATNSGVESVSYVANTITEISDTSMDSPVVLRVDTGSSTLTFESAWWHALQPAMPALVQAAAQPRAFLPAEQVVLGETEGYDLYGPPSLTTEATVGFARVCPLCYEATLGSHRYCQECGYKLPKADTDDSADQAKTPSSKSSKPSKHRRDKPAPVPNSGLFFVRSADPATDEQGTSATPAAHEPEAPEVAEVAEVLVVPEVLEESGLADESDQDSATQTHVELAPVHEATVQTARAKAVDFAADNDEWGFTGTDVEVGHPEPAVMPELTPQASDYSDVDYLDVEADSSGFIESHDIPEFGSAPATAALPTVSERDPGGPSLRPSLSTPWPTFESQGVSSNVTKSGPRPLVAWPFAACAAVATALLTFSAVHIVTHIPDLVASGSGLGMFIAEILTVVVVAIVGLAGLYAWTGIGAVRGQPVPIWLGVVLGSAGATVVAIASTVDSRFASTMPLPAIGVAAGIGLVVFGVLMPRSWRDLPPAPTSAKNTLPSPVMASTVLASWLEIFYLLNGIVAIPLLALTVVRKDDEVVIGIIMIVGSLLAAFVMRWVAIRFKCAQISLATVAAGVIFGLSLIGLAASFAAVHHAGLEVLPLVIAVIAVFMVMAMPEFSRKSRKRRHRRQMKRTER